MGVFGILQYYDRLFFLGGSAATAELRRTFPVIGPLNEEKDASRQPLFSDFSAENISEGKSNSRSSSFSSSVTNILVLVFLERKSACCELRGFAKVCFLFGVRESSLFTVAVTPLSLLLIEFTAPLPQALRIGDTWSLVRDEVVDVFVVEPPDASKTVCSWATAEVNPCVITRFEEAFVVWFSCVSNTESCELLIFRWRRLSNLFNGEWLGSIVLALSPVGGLPRWELSFGIFSISMSPEISWFGLAPLSLSADKPWPIPDTSPRWGTNSSRPSFLSTISACRLNSSSGSSGNLAKTFFVTLTYFTRCCSISHNTK